MLWFFLTRHPCRIVTTSAKDQHLRVLWGEIGQAIGTARYALDSKRGGPLVCNHHDLRKLLKPGDKNSRCPLSYVVGMVASQDSQAAMQGHHATATLEDYLQRGLAEDEAGIDHALPRSLFVVDEASSVPDYYMGLAQTWAKRIFVFGNPWPCSNFFYRDVEGAPGSEDRGGDLERGDATDDGGRAATSGDLQSGVTLPGEVGVGRSAATTPPRDRQGDGVVPTGAGRAGYLRRVIRITADDSPNVRLAHAELAAGKEPSGRVLVPGVLTWQDYLDRKRTYDEHQQAVSLGGRFYKGKELFLFPELWLHKAMELAKALAGKPRRARAVGVDPGEGEANTALAAVDEFGLVDLLAVKTPDTALIYKLVFDFVRKHNVPWDNVVFDRGGGGKQIADVLRNGATFHLPTGETVRIPGGYMVRTVGFGESIRPDPKPTGMKTGLPERKEVREDNYAYRKRRGELYGELSLMLDPGFIGTTLGETRVQLKGFAIPPLFMRVLWPQMSVIPKWRDEEGQLVIPSKSRKPGQDINEKKKTLTELVGRSPDELESVCLAVHGLLHKPRRSIAGVA